jgi:hypothetical protein
VSGRGSVGRLTASGRWAAAIVPLAAIVVAACGGGRALPPADATYSVRGQVEALPHAGSPDLYVHHEEVKGFIGRDGKPAHMDSMTMPFTPAADVPLTGIAVGDKVAMTFEVRWHADPLLRVVKLEKLPADTILDLGGPTLEKVAPLGSEPAATTAPSASASTSPTAGAEPGTAGSEVTPTSSPATNGESAPGALAPGATPPAPGGHGSHGG